MNKDKLVRYYFRALFIASIVAHLWGVPMSSTNSVAGYLFSMLGMTTLVMFVGGGLLVWCLFLWKLMFWESEE